MATRERSDTQWFAVCDTCWQIADEPHGREIDAGWNMLIEDDPDDGRMYHQCPECQAAEVRQRVRPLVVLISEPTETDRLTLGGVLGALLGLIGFAVLVVTWIA